METVLFDRIFVQVKKSMKLLNLIPPMTVINSIPLITIVKMKFAAKFFDFNIGTLIPLNEFYAGYLFEEKFHNASPGKRIRFKKKSCERLTN